MSYAFDNDLFVTENGAPMCFNISKCSNMGELKDYILYAGGEVETSEAPGPHTIMCQDEESNCPENTIVFSSEFIMKCCSRNKLFNLNKFRLNSPSTSTKELAKEFNAMDILLHKTTWEDAKQFLNLNNVDQQSKRLSEAESDEVNSSSPESVSEHSSAADKVVLTKALGPQSNSSRYRCEFTQKEKKQIVQYLHDCKGYKEMKGTAIWKRMSRKFPNHTWQSLKEHFNKKIMPFIGSFGLPAEVVKEFRKGMQTTIARRGPIILNAYSEDDDTLILKYVSKYGKSAKLGGNVFWQEMESKNILPNRSWHSLRERYRKYLKDKPQEETPSASSSKRFSGKRKSSPIIETSSDSEGITSHADQITRPTKKTSPQDISENINNKEKEVNTEGVVCRKKKKLFTLTQNFESPSSNIPELSPISVKPKGPSMLDILKRNHQKHVEAKQRKFRALLRKQAASRRSDEDQSEDELNKQQCEEEEENEDQQQREDEEQSEDQQQSEDEELSEDRQQSGVELGNEDKQKSEDEEPSEDRQQSAKELGNEVQSDIEQTNLVKGSDEVNQTENGWQDDEIVRIAEDEMEDGDETQYDIHSNSTVETPLPCRTVPRSSGSINGSIFNDDDLNESDESDWSLDGLYSRGTMIKRPENTKFNKAHNLAKEQDPSMSALITVSNNPGISPITDRENPPNSAKKNISVPSGSALNDCTEEPFDFLGDMTHLSQLSENSHVPDFSQKVDCAVPLSGTTTASSNNCIQNSQNVEESQPVSNQDAESERSVAVFSIIPKNGIVFKPSLHSTQKGTRDVAVQQKEKVNVATQTEPVLVLPLWQFGQSSITNRKRKSTTKSQNFTASSEPPSPVSASRKTIHLTPRRRIATRSAARDSDSDEGLSPKFTPPS